MIYSEYTHKCQVYFFTITSWSTVSMIMTALGSRTAWRQENDKTDKNLEILFCFTDIEQKKNITNDIDKLENAHISFS